MTVKKETTFWNFFAVGYLWFVSIAIGGFVNAWMVYLLGDEDYFDVEEDFIGRTTSNILVFGFLAGAAYAVIGGWVFDRFARKWPIFVGVLL